MKLLIWKINQIKSKLKKILFKKNLMNIKLKDIRALMIKQNII